MSANILSILNWMKVRQSILAIGKGISPTIIANIVWIVIGCFLIIMNGELDGVALGKRKKIIPPGIERQYSGVLPVSLEILFI